MDTILHLKHRRKHRIELPEISLLEWDKQQMKLDMDTMQVCTVIMMTKMEEKVKDKLD